MENTNEINNNVAEGETNAALNPVEGDEVVIGAVAVEQVTETDELNNVIAFPAPAVAE